MQNSNSKHQITDNVQIFIIGQSRIHNQGISRAIISQLGHSCLLALNTAELSVLPNGKDSLFLIDSLKMERDELVELLHSSELPTQPTSKVVLINLCPQKRVEKLALDSGVKGFFYEQDTLDSLMKGIQAILNGEIWIAREKLAECYLSGEASSATGTTPLLELTQREKEIFKLVVDGNTNEEITEKLHISPNTVKTHMYRAFNKVGVKGRFQALCWAAKNM